MTFKLLIISFLFLVGCSSVEEVNVTNVAESTSDHSDIEPPSTAPTTTEALGAKLVGISGSSVDFYMNKGEIAFRAGDYRTAIDNFKTVIELQKAAKWGRAAEALYRMGMCYEFLGDDAKAIATYQDALKRKKNLTFELGNMEIPARLAMSYMRIGQLKTARTYFLKAEKGIAKLRTNLGDYEEKSEWLAEILFGMGRISSQIKRDKNFEDTIYSIEHAQNYLLFALEINDSKWSPKAGEELEKLYRAGYENINEMKGDPGKDPVVTKRSLQEKQRKMGYTLLDQMSNLEDQILPEVENKTLKKTLERLSITKKEIEKLVESRPIGEGLTEEAKKFESPKREGKIKDE